MKPADRLADAEAVALVLASLGRPGVAFRGATTEKFSCLLPGHVDLRPSASLHLGKDDGRWSYRCHACAVSLTLAELFATVRAGRLIEFDGQRPTVARWLFRMWHEAGVDPVQVVELDVPIDLTPAERRFAEGFLLLRALRHHHGDHDAVPYTHRFAAAWCGFSEKTAQRAARKLTDCGWLRLKEQPPGMRCGFLYDLGPVLPQTGNPFTSTVAWTVFGEDGLPAGGLAPPVRDPLLNDVSRQERDPVPPQVGFPRGAAAVEMQSGSIPVDEGNDLHHVAEVDLAERVAAFGGFDAASGAAGRPVVHEAKLTGGLRRFGMHVGKPAQNPPYPILGRFGRPN